MLHLDEHTYIGAARCIKILYFTKYTLGYLNKVNPGACVAGGTLEMTQNTVIMKSLGDGMQLLHEGGSATAPQVSRTVRHASIGA